MFIGHVFDEWYVKRLQMWGLLRLCKRDCDYSNCSTKNRRVELGLLGWNLFQLLIQPNKKWLDRRGNVKDNVGPHYFHGFWVTPWGQVTFFIVPVYLLNIMIHNVQGIFMAFLSQKLMLKLFINWSRYWSICTWVTWVWIWRAARQPYIAPHYNILQPAWESTQGWTISSTPCKIGLWCDTALHSSSQL